MSQDVSRSQESATSDQNESFASQVARYRLTAEKILKEGARVDSRQLEDLVRAHHEPYPPAVRAAVQQVLNSGEYSTWGLHYDRQDSYMSLQDGERARQEREKRQKVYDAVADSIDHPERAVPRVRRSADPQKA